MILRRCPTFWRIHPRRRQQNAWAAGVEALASVAKWTILVVSSSLAVFLFSKKFSTKLGFPIGKTRAASAAGSSQVAGKPHTTKPPFILVKHHSRSGQGLLEFRVALVGDTRGCDPSYVIHVSSEGVVIWVRASLGHSVEECKGEGQGCRGASLREAVHGFDLHWASALRVEDV